LGKAAGVIVVANHRFGFYTSQLIIDPYLTYREIWADCEADLIPNLFRRPVSKRGFYIIRREEVEPYFRSKSLPPDIIEMKLKSLGIMSAKQKQDLLKDVLNGDVTQLSMLDRILKA